MNLAPGVLKEEQESVMQSIEEQCTEEHSLQKSASAVRRPLCVHVPDRNSYTLTKVTNYINT